MMLQNVMLEHLDLLTFQVDQFPALRALQMIACAVMLCIVLFHILEAGAGTLLKYLLLDRAFFNQGVQLTVDRRRSDRFTLLLKVITHIIGGKMLSGIRLQKILYFLPLLGLILNLRRHDLTSKK